MHFNCFPYFYAFGVFVLPLIRFLAGRGALMAFFAFLPTIGEAIAIVLGLMRSNVWLTGGSMLAGKALRYIVVLATFEGAASLF